MIKVADINKTTNLKGTGKVAKSSGGESFSAYLNETFQAKSSQINPSMALSMTEAILAAQVTDDEMEKEVRRNTPNVSLLPRSDQRSERGHRTHRHPAPLARYHGRRGRPRRQGHLVREAHDAYHR